MQACSYPYRIQDTRHELPDVPMYVHGATSQKAEEKEAKSHGHVVSPANA